jgi:hypothetical protein
MLYYTCAIFYTLFSCQLIFKVHWILMSAIIYLNWELNPILFNAKIILPLVGVNCTEVDISLMSKISKAFL